MYYEKSEELDTSTGKVLTHYEIDHIDDDIIVIKEDDKYGLMILEGKNLTAKVLVKPIYDSISEFQYGVAVVEKDNMYGIINKLGEVLTVKWFEYIYDFSDGVAVFLDNGSYGLVKNTGEILIEPKYQDISSFEHGYAIVSNEITIKKKERQSKGLIDTNGDLVLETIYGDIYVIDNENAIGIDFKGNVYYIDIKKKTKKKINYERAYFYQQMDKSITINTDHVFSKVKIFNPNDLIHIKNEDDYCVYIHPVDPVVYFCSYLDYRLNKTKFFPLDDYFITQNNELFDNNGQLLISNKYDKCVKVEKDIFIVDKKDPHYSFQLYNAKEKKFITPIYKEIRVENDNIIIFRDNLRWNHGILDSSGKVLIEAKYFHLISVKKEKSMLILDHLDGIDIYDLNGNLIISNIEGNVNIYNDQLIIINNQIFEISSLKKKYYLNIGYNNFYKKEKVFDTLEEREKYEQEFKNSMGPILEDIEKRKEKYIENIEKFMANKFENEVKKYEKIKSKEK